MVESTTNSEAQNPVIVKMDESGGDMKPSHLDDQFQDQGGENISNKSVDPFEEMKDDPENIPCEFLRFLNNAEDDQDKEEIEYQLKVYINPEAHLPKKQVDESQVRKQNSKSGFSLKKLWNKLTSDSKVQEREEMVAMMQTPKGASNANGINRVTQMTFSEVKFVPIPRLDTGAFTFEEWMVILNRSDPSLHPESQSILAEHLSRTRLRTSLVEGLETVGMERQRGEIWKLISKVRQQRAKYNTDVYQKVLNERDPHMEYKIGKDVHRTVPGKTLFQEPCQEGKNKLYNVLKAYSNFDPAIGYCQGINFLASVLLQQIPDEEDCFWVLVFLMNDREWRDIFDQHSNKIARLLKDLEGYIMQNLPDLYQHFCNDEYMTMEAAFTSQIITLFIYDASQDVSDRIFELFLLEGEQVIVDLLAVMIEKKEHKLLQLSELVLMNYMRRDLITEVFTENSISSLLSRTPLVNLSYVI